MLLCAMFSLAWLLITLLLLVQDGEKNVSLGTSITVVFDKDVWSMNINKLFEVKDLHFLG